MKRPDYRALFAVVGMAVLFGASFTGTKVALESFTPAQLIFLRFAAASLLFLGVRFFRPAEKLKGKDFAGLFLLALFEPGIYFYCEAQGVKRTLASTAAILISAIPMFVLVLEALWLKVRIRFAEVFLIVLSLGGIFLIVAAGGLDKAFGGTLLGNVLVLLAALAASIYTILAKKMLSRVEPLTVTFYQSLFASMIYLPFAAFDTVTSGLKLDSARPLLALVYLAVFCSFLAYWLLNFALSRMKASFVSAFTNLIPVVGIAVAVLFLGERLYPLQFIGAAVVLCCMTVLTLVQHSGRGIKLPAPEG